MRRVASCNRSNFNGSRKILAIAIFTLVIALLTFPLLSTASSSDISVGTVAGEISKSPIVKGTKPESTKPFFLVPSLPQTGPVSVATFAGDCTTSKTLFNLQDSDKTVCTKVTGALPGWQIIWSNAHSVAVQKTPIPGTDATGTFLLSTNSSLGDWRVIVLDPLGGTVQTLTAFTVIDENNPSADVFISKGSISSASATGSQVLFTLQVTNGGPSDAATVQLSDPIPADTSFVSFDQLSGPIFTCDNPSAGSSSGVSVCTVPSMARGETATFVATYQVSGGVAAGTSIVNTANVSSITPDPTVPAADPSEDNNTSSSKVEVASTPCQINTADNITVNAANGEAGAIVNYNTPTFTGDCGQGGTGESGESVEPISCSPSSGSFFPIGTTSVICVAEAGPALSFQITVDNPGGGLTISLNGANPITHECGTPFGDPGATAINGAGQSVEVSISGASCDLDGNCIGRDTQPGTYTLTYTAVDGENSLSTTRTVIVADTQAPKITIDGANPYKIQQGSCSPFVDPGVSGSDDCGGSKPVTSSISGPGGATSVNPNVPGNYIITYISTDGTHQATTTRTVMVGNFPDDEVDQPSSANVPPTITLNGNDQITIECGTLFTDPRATATACGASVSVTTSGTVDIHTPGTYSITYTASANGFTSEATRIVTVDADTTAPIITLNGSTPLTVECHTTFTDPGAVAHDACAGDFAATASGLVNPNVVGQYTITYNATDPSGHAAIPVTRVVNVVDTTKPVVTAPANVTVYTGAGATSCSVLVSDAALGSASATDSCQGSLATTRTGVPAGNVFPTGTTTITYSATDASQNIGTATQTVTVIDNTPPTISCPANIIADFDPAVNGAVVTFTPPVGTDNCAVTTTQVAGLASGSTFPAGTTTNTFRVTDGAGNSAECSFKVTVALTSIIGLDNVSVLGMSFVDSYDSAGGYPATKGALANMLSNGTITLSNSGKVWGRVRSTRAGAVMSGTSQVTGNATAGTTVSRTGSATVLGTITNNLLAPVMTVPSVPACGPPYSPNSGITGTYSYNATTGDLTLSGNNIATLANGSYCFRNVTLSNSAQLKVNGPVVIKLTGIFTASGATSLTNTTAIPGNLRILSSNTGTNGLTLSNGTSAHLIIFAPSAGVTVTGAAPLFGTITGKTVTVSNSGVIHYDIQVKSAWPDIWALISGP